MSTAPASAERILLAAWNLESPGQMEHHNSLARLPVGFWIDVGRRAVELALRGVSEEELESLEAAALAHYNTHWSHIREAAPPRKPAPLPAKTKADKTALLLEALLGGKND